MMLTISISYVKLENISPALGDLFSLNFYLARFDLDKHARPQGVLPRPSAKGLHLPKSPNPSSPWESTAGGIVGPKQAAAPVFPYPTAFPLGGVLEKWKRGAHYRKLAPVLVHGVAGPGVFEVGR